MSKISKYLDTISDLLEQERTSVKSADLESAITISGQISQMLDAPPVVEKITPDVTLRIEKLRGEAARNAQLYKLAISTVKETQKTMRAIEDAFSNLNTYDPEGSIQDVAIKKKNVEKKV